MSLKRLVLLILILIRLVMMRKISIFQLHKIYNLLWRYYHILMISYCKISQTYKNLWRIENQRMNQISHHLIYNNEHLKEFVNALDEEMRNITSL
jgi:hypothetical protein